MGTYAYDKAATRFYALKLNRKTDADLIDLLDRQQNVQRFLKDLMRDALRTRENHSGSEGPQMKRISVDNGKTWVYPQDALAAVSWDALVSAMDDDVREQVHRDLAPCTELDFLTRYLQIAPCDLVIG